MSRIIYCNDIPGGGFSFLTHGFCHLPWTSILTNHYNLYSVRLPDEKTPQNVHASILTGRSFVRKYDFFNSDSHYPRFYVNNDCWKLVSSIP